MSAFTHGWPQRKMILVIFLCSNIFSLYSKARLIRYKICYKMRENHSRVRHFEFHWGSCALFMLLLRLLLRWRVITIPPCFISSNNLIQNIVTIVATKLQNLDTARWFWFCLYLLRFYLLSCPMFLVVFP